MSSADFNNLALRRTVSYQPDGSFVTDGYLFTVSTNGRQNWTNSISLNQLTLSTFILNSPLVVSTVKAIQGSYSTLYASSASVSSGTASTLYAANMGYGVLTGSSILTSSLNTPVVGISSVVASSMSGNAVSATSGTFTTLTAAAALASTMNAIAVITCTMAASTINFTVVNFAVSNVSSLTNNTLSNTSTIFGSSMTLINLSTSALSLSTLQASTIAGSALTLTSSLQTSSMSTSGLRFSTATGSSLVLTAVSTSGVAASTVSTGSIGVTGSLAASTMVGSTLSTGTLLVQSTAVISTMTVTTINYTTLLGNSATMNAGQIRSTLTVSTVNATNVVFTTLTGANATMNGLSVNSTLGVSTVNTLNTTFSTSVGSTLTVSIGAVGSLRASTLSASTLSANGVTVNSTLTVSSIGFSTVIGSTLVVQDVQTGTLEVGAGIMSTLTVASTLGVSSVTVGSLGYSTMQGSTLSVAWAVASTITGSTINFQNLGFSSLLISTITCNTAFPLLLGASTMATQSLQVSTLLSLDSSATLGIGTTAPVYPLSVANGGLLGLEVNQTGAPLGSTMYGSGVVYSVTHPASGFRGEYAYAYGGATVLASAAESQAVGYFAVDVANAGIFGTKALGVPTAATMYIDNTKTTMVGALGVGTTSPAWMTTILKDLAMASMTMNPMDAQLVVGGKTNGSVVKIGAYSTGGASSFAAAMQSSYMVNGSDTIGTLMLNPLGGKVGVGISTPPAFALDLGVGGGGIQAGSIQITGLSATPGYLRLSTAGSVNRIESGTLATTGSGAPLYMTNYGATSVWLSVGPTGLVGIGTTSAVAPLHVYGAAGVSLASSATVNYTQTTALGFNFGGGVGNGTRDSFQMTVAVVNRDGGAGPTYYDTGAQCDLVFKRKTNGYYIGNPSDQTYTEVMRLGGATGLVGIGTTATAGTLGVWASGSTSTVAGYWGSALTDTVVDWETTASGGRRWRIGTAATASTVAGGGSLYMYDVTGSATRMVITPTGSIGIGTTAPTSTLHVIGNIYASGTITNGSDARFKADLRVVESALDKLDRIRGYTYSRTDYAEPAPREMGLIAQEVKEVFPELVMSEGRGEEERLRLNYSGMIAPLVEAVRELKAQVSALQLEVAILRGY